MVGTQLGIAARWHRGQAGYAGQLTVWLVMLGLAELADLMTTHADRLQGGIEANQVAAFTLGVGGPALFWGLKLSLVIAMAVVVLLAIRFGRSFPGRRARIIQSTVARGLQVCVLLLTLSALGNLVVLAYPFVSGGST